MNAMKKAANAAQKTVQVWSDFVIKFKWPVLIFTMLLAFGLGSQGKMEFDGDYHVFFSESNPELEAFDALQEKYTKDDNVLIVLSPSDENVFTKENLVAIEALTAEAWNTPYSSRVDAVTNFQYTSAVGDDLYVDDLSFESESKSVAEIEEIKNRALTEPLLVNRLINEKGSVTAINVTIKLPGENSSVEIPEVTAFTRAMIDDFKADYPQFDVHTSGLVPLNTAFFESSMRDMMLTMLMFLVVIFTTFILTRNIYSTIATLVIVMLSIISAVGFVGLTGIKLTPPSSVFPTMVLTLAVADSIHILITMLQKMRKDGLDKISAIKESMRLNFMPVLITSLTTVIGFLTMNFGDVPPFWDLGNVTAFGMTMAFLYSTTALPALMAILPVRVKQTQKINEKPSWYTTLGTFVSRRPVSLSLASITLIGVMTFMATKNEFNDEFINYFDQSVDFRTETDYISNNLTGIYNIEFSVPSGESGGINNPEYLNKLNSFENWLYEQPEVIHVNAFNEVAKRVNRSMHGDDENYYTIPESREEAAQYLLLYELSLPFGLDLNNQINVDKSETRLTATIENISSAEMIAFTDRAEDWLKGNTPEAMHTLGVSPSLMFSKLGFRQAKSMFRGNIIALILISLVLILALQNFKLGMLSIIPNVAPVLVGFGIWAMYMGKINTGMVIVFGMTLGIIVDDTVHFMSKFLRARRELGYNSREAVTYAFETVGKALVTTTIVLMAGFAILSTSSFALNSYMARITTVIILSALIIDFILLPSLLILMSREDQNETRLQPQLIPISNKNKNPFILKLKNMKNLFFGLIAFFLIGTLTAQTPQERGLQIAILADESDQGFGSTTVELKMTLKNKNGQTSERHLINRIYEQTEDGDKSLIVFNSPKDVKGTSTLTYTHKEGADDQWLYLPSIKRVKRISSNNKSGPFVGSEFAYEDLSSQEVEKYAYKFLEEKGELLVVEQDPVDPKSGYTRRVVTYNKDKGYRIEKADFYDRKNTLLKTLTYSDYELYKGKHWRAGIFHMKNHQTDKETVLAFSEYNFDSSLSDDDFSQAALVRAGK